MSDYNSLSHRLWYAYCRGLCRIFFVAFFGIRSFGYKNIPTKGGALLACNHQSFLDPMAAGSCVRRQVHYLARDSLFRKPGFGWLIRSANAFPVKRGAADLAAVKESLRRLKDGQLLLLFGEGTRSHDGRIAPLQPGMAMMARRTKVPLIPVVIDGAFEAWPRNKKIWSLHTIRVMYGKPITTEQIAPLSDKDAVQIIYQRQQEMQHLLRRRYGRKPYTYPPLESQS
jgi:1-acyl-sn-glycerol-3-phosphate acyltransferase